MYLSGGEEIPHREPPHWLGKKGLTGYGKYGIMGIAQEGNGKFRIPPSW